MPVTQGMFLMAKLFSLTAPTLWHYFQLTYAAWFISTSRPSRPSRKPMRKKYAQMNLTMGRSTMLTKLKLTLRSSATICAPKRRIAVGMLDEALQR